MDAKKNKSPAKIDMSDGDSEAIRFYRLFSANIGNSDSPVPLEKILDEAIKILDLDSVRLIIFNKDKTTVEYDIFKSRLNNFSHNVKPLDLLHFITDDKNSIVIKEDAQSMQNVKPDALGQGKDLIIIPLLRNSDIFGLLIAGKYLCADINEYVKTLEAFSIQLSWFYNYSVLWKVKEQALKEAELLRRELDESLSRETGEIIDNEKKLENVQAQLFQSEKFSSLGKLIAGVAHEIKNPMTGIKGYVSLISRLFDKMEINKNHKNLLDGLEMAVSHLEYVVNNFLSFSRRDEGKHEKIRIEEVIRRTEAIIKNYLKIKKIKLTIKYSDELPEIYGDLNQLIEVYMNLIINAEQAIFYNDGLIDVFVYGQNDRVYTEVRDNGIGIKEINLPRIYDSFFTTKGIGKSTGIGLSVVKQIVDNHLGTIEVISKEMLGTKFIVSFPVA